MPDYHCFGAFGARSRNISLRMHFVHAPLARSALSRFAPLTIPQDSTSINFGARSTRKLHETETKMSQFEDVEHGVDPCVLSSLPVFTHSEASQGSEECLVCLEAYEPGDQILRLPCLDLTTRRYAIEIPGKFRMPMEMSN